MEKQVEAVVLPPTGSLPRRVHWLICDNGMTVAEGIAQVDADTGVWGVTTFCEMGDYFCENFGK